MKKGSPIVMLSTVNRGEGQTNSSLAIKGIEIEICGEPVSMQIDIRGQKATLMDLIPLARSLVAQTVQIVLKQTLKAGSSIPCAKGCSACCFHLIPLSIPEAVYLAEEVMGMSSEWCTEIERRCWEIASQAEQSFSDFATKNTIRSLQDVHKIGNWFQGLKLACPFLMDHRCLIYTSRPGICREWLVTGTALECLSGIVTDNMILQMAGSMTSALAQLTANLQQCQEEIIPLYLMFKCRSDNMNLFSRTWPSIYLIDEYVKTVVRLQERKARNAIP